MRGRHGMGGVAPSLISMSNGSVVRNLMGATTNDSHIQRLWGTKGAAEIVDGHLRIRLGGSGSSPKLEVIPHWDELGELAASTGHGGGDFWVLYYFARQILTGEPAPFDTYSACDCTIPGVLAYRSQIEAGRPYAVPDFRDKAQRERYRNDHYDQPRYDVEKGVFPKGADYELTKHFSRTMRDLIGYVYVYRGYRDWSKVIDDLASPSNVLPLAERLIETLPQMQETQKLARRMIDAYPESDAARVLGDMLKMTDEPITSKPDFLKKLKAERSRLAKQVDRIAAARERAARASTSKDKWNSLFVSRWQVSKLLRKKGSVADAAAVKLSDRLGWRPLAAVPAGDMAGFVSLHSLFQEQDGLVYIGNRFKASKRGTWTIHVGHDGGSKLFVDRKPVLSVPSRVNPATHDRSKVDVTLARGTHEIVIAFDTDSGMGWGFYFRFEVPRPARKKGIEPAFPLVVEDA